MQKTIVRYGLISGAISSSLMIITSLVGKAIIEKNGNLTQFFDYGLYLGFTCIILSLTLVFVGIKSFRDNQNGGKITFAKAFQIGILVTVISCVFYALTWLVCFYNLFPTFMEDYGAYHLQQLKESGASATLIAQQTTEMQQAAKDYQNPFYNFAITFMEPFPVGLLMTVVSAFVLKKK